MKSILLIIISFLFVGCASLGLNFSKRKEFNKNKALVYVYRVKRFMGSVVSPYICIDGETVAELPNGSYFSVELLPGKHEIYRKVIGGEASNFNFTVEAGNTYYIRNDMTLENGAKEHIDGGMSVVGGGGAIGAMVGMAFASGKDVKDNVTNNIDPRAQKKTSNPGFLTVRPSFAEKEIVKTKLFKIPTYKKNYCFRK